MTSPGNYRNTIQKALAQIQETFGPTPPNAVIVLGSGLGKFAERVSDAHRLSYTDIPGFEKTTIQGHQGECIVGTLSGKRILIYQGRFHYYEGHSLPIVALPVRVAGAWGIRHLVVTNAAGAIRQELQPGSLFILKDHINLLGQGPLRGPNLDEFGERFIDMTVAYDADHRKLAHEIAQGLHLDLREGVYAAMPGPNYETPAEIRMLATMGADVVGMSTVPEVLVARHHGMRVLGISCITNWAAGVLGAQAVPIHHEEVMEYSRKAEENFSALLTEWMKRYE